MRFLPLFLHPQSNCHATRDIYAGAERTGKWSMGFTYVVKGELDQLRIPAKKRTRAANRLWEHTCFEAFIGVKAEAAYYELNFSPSSEWTIYAFRDYRKKAALENYKLKPEITLHAKKDYMEFQVKIDFKILKKIPSQAMLRVGLSAVIEEKNGALSYWALRHPPGEPDFHHPDAFALEILPPNVAAGVNSAYLR